MPNSYPCPSSLSCIALKIRLDFIFYLFLMFKAMRLPSSMASVVNCSTLLLRHFPRSTVSTQYDSKMPNSYPKRFSSGYSSTRPNRRLKFSLLSPNNCTKVSCSRWMCYLSSDSALILKSQLKDSNSLVTSSKNATMQFCCGRARIDSGGLTLAGKDFLLGRKEASAGCLLFNSAIFFLRKLFSLLSCSISMRQQRSSSMSDSESLKLCAQCVCSEPRKGRRGASEQVDRFTGFVSIINKIAYRYHNFQYYYITQQPYPIPFNTWNVLILYHQHLQSSQIISIANPIIQNMANFSYIKPGVSFMKLCIRSSI